MVKRLISCVVCFSFILTNLTSCQAQADFVLPAPGKMVNLSPPFAPAILKGLKVHAENPFFFDFVLDPGDSSSARSQEELKQESARLIKYFLASLTIPENDLWVNLSPYEKNRIIPQSFGLTQMGRDLLAEDYMLKQITASMIYPEGGIGRRFWERVYKEAAKRFGTTRVAVNTFNKVWILPDKALVYENVKAKTAYVVESKLKVMLEEDYLSLEKHSHPFPQSRAPRSNLPHKGRGINALGSQIIREIVIPELTKEVNEDKNFVVLRQVYNSLILATWYKKKIKDSILAQVYADKNKVSGIGYEPLPTSGHVPFSRAMSPSTLPNAGLNVKAAQGDKPNDVERIYQRYLSAFKKGVYNYIKEEGDILTQQIVPRKYFSGGVVIKVSPAMTSDPSVVKGPGEDDTEDRSGGKTSRRSFLMVSASLGIGSFLLGLSALLCGNGGCSSEGGDEIKLLPDLLPILQEDPTKLGLLTAFLGTVTREGWTRTFLADEEKLNANGRNDDNRAVELYGAAARSTAMWLFALSHYFGGAGRSYALSAWRNTFGFRGSGLYARVDPSLSDPATYPASRSSTDKGEEKDMKPTLRPPGMPLSTVRVPNRLSLNPREHLPPLTTDAWDGHVDTESVVYLISEAIDLGDWQYAKRLMDLVFELWGEEDGVRNGPRDMDDKNPDDRIGGDQNENFYKVKSSVTMNILIPALEKLSARYLLEGKYRRYQEKAYTWLKNNMQTYKGMGKILPFAIHYDGRKKEWPQSEIVVLEKILDFSPLPLITSPFEKFVADEDIGLSGLEAMIFQTELLTAMYKKRDGIKKRKVLGFSFNVRSAQNGIISIEATVGMARIYLKMEKAYLQRIKQGNLKKGQEKKYRARARFNREKFENLMGALKEYGREVKGNLVLPEAVDVNGKAIGEEYSQQMPSIMGGSGWRLHYGYGSLVSNMAFFFLKLQEANPDQSTDGDPLSLDMKVVVDGPDLDPSTFFEPVNHMGEEEGVSDYIRPFLERILETGYVPSDPDDRLVDILADLDRTDKIMQARDIIDTSSSHTQEEVDRANLLLKLKEARDIIRNRLLYTQQQIESAKQLLGQVYYQSYGASPGAVAEIASVPGVRGVAGASMLNNSLGQLMTEAYLKALGGEYRPDLQSNLSVSMDNPMEPGGSKLLRILRAVLLDAFDNEDVMSLWDRGAKAIDSVKVGMSYITNYKEIKDPQLLPYFQAHVKARLDFLKFMQDKDGGIVEEKNKIKNQDGKVIREENGKAKELVTAFRTVILIKEYVALTGDHQYDDMLEQLYGWIKSMWIPFNPVDPENSGYFAPRMIYKDGQWERYVSIDDDPQAILAVPVEDVMNLKNPHWDFMETPGFPSDKKQNRFARLAHMRDGVLAPKMVFHPLGTAKASLLSFSKSKGPIRLASFEYTTELASFDWRLGGYEPQYLEKYGASRDFLEAYFKGSGKKTSALGVWFMNSDKGEPWERKPVNAGNTTYTPFGTESSAVAVGMAYMEKPGLNPWILGPGDSAMATLASTPTLSLIAPAKSTTHLLPPMGIQTPPKARGGIDLTAANKALQMRMDSQDPGGNTGIRFHIDPAMLSRLQKAPGFEIVAINIQPLKSLPEFLGFERDPMDRAKV